MWSPYAQLVSDHQAERVAAAQDYRLARLARARARRTGRRALPKPRLWLFGAARLVMKGS